MNSRRAIAVCVILGLASAPALSFAKAGGGYRGGGAGGGSMSSGSMGSRGTRTHEENGFKRIDRSASAPQPAQPSQPLGRPGAAPVSQQPVGQPSFLQRHPILSGVAAGIAGSWIGHMLFGSTNASAHPESGAGRDSQGDADSPSSSMGFVLLLMALAAVGLFYFLRGRRTSTGNMASAFSGLGSGTPGLGIPAPASAGTFQRTLGAAPDLTHADEDEFRRCLVEIQTAWGRQDMTALRMRTTPEIYQYFVNLLSENTSQGVVNLVGQVSVTGLDVREVWDEDERIYATVLLRWTALDHTVSAAKQPGEAGYLLEGDPHVAREFAEGWTFVKHRQGKWLLSAIQQV